LAVSEVAGKILRDLGDHTLLLAGQWVVVDGYWCTASLPGFDCPLYSTQGRENEDDKYMKLFDRLEDAKDADCVVWVGYDPMEDASAKMLAHSIRSRTKMGIRIIPIVRDELLSHDLCTRPIDPNGSTQFSITRFMVPHLMHNHGVGIFFDCDMLITRDIQEMFDLFDPRFAVQVAKHDYTPKTTHKMGGLPQTMYPRKNWSAAVMYNCDHPSTQGLTREVVERETPKFLHRFEWLRDDEIGGLPLECNFLVEEMQEPKEGLPFNIHHTLGAPIFRERQHVPYASYWKQEFRATFGREFDPKRDIVNPTD
jgi:hypothetical protein